jgi:hypothetical protein
MTNNKQQTAVDWYIEKLLDLDYEYAKGLITLGVWSERKNSLIQQAKEMEKKRTIEFCIDWYFNGTVMMKKIDVKSTIEQHFNETYGGGEQ